MTPSKRARDASSKTLAVDGTPSTRWTAGTTRPGERRDSTMWAAGVDDVGPGDGVVDDHDLPDLRVANAISPSRKSVKTKGLA